MDSTLSQFAGLRGSAVPAKGWIRAIRDALGMTGEQLAARLKVNKQRISRIEQDERLGRVTVKTLKNVAEGLSCEFVYGFVPRKSLEQIVAGRARSVAARRMERSDQTMRLENQELSKEEKREAMEAMVKEIIEQMPRSLWDE